MKSSTEDQVKGKRHEGKGKTKVLVKQMKDPTLEGKDENTIGRIQSKTAGRSSLEK
jgi:hypothetical protein